MKKSEYEIREIETIFFLFYVEPQHKNKDAKFPIMFLLYNNKKIKHL